MNDTALKLGVFNQRCFYNAFAEFDNQNIETSLKSENLIVRISRYWIDGSVNGVWYQ